MSRLVHGVALITAVSMVGCGRSSGVASDGGGGNTCIPGASCEPAECRAGTVSCVSGTAECVESGPAPNGTACGAGTFCKAGTCTASTCEPNQGCQPANPCTLGTTSCSSPVADPSCNVKSNKGDGTTCGPGLVCSGGSCVSATACTAGATCEPSNPCAVGTISCPSSTPPGRCTATGSRGDGESCGVGLVCSTGGCVPECVPNVACDVNACATGVTTCSSLRAAPVCNLTASKPDGTPCGANGEACMAATCIGVGPLLRSQ